MHYVKEVFFQTLLESSGYVQLLNQLTRDQEFLYYEF